MLIVGSEEEKEEIPQVRDSDRMNTYCFMQTSDLRAVRNDSVPESTTARTML